MKNWKNKIKPTIKKLVVGVLAGLTAWTILASPVDNISAYADTNSKDLKTAGVFSSMGSSIGSNLSVSAVSCMSKAGILAALDEYNLKAVDAEDKIAEYVNEFQNVAIAKVDGSVNIRSKIGDSGKIVGKLSNKSMGVILAEKNGWYKIKSGHVKGWIKKNYVVTGNAARKLARKVGDRVATVRTTTLRVRKSPDNSSITLTVVPEGVKLRVLKESSKWVKVQIDEDIKGWVSKDFVNLDTEFKKAETIKEYDSRLAEEKSERTVTVADNNKATDNNKKKKHNKHKKKNKKQAKGKKKNNLRQAKNKKHKKKDLRQAKKHKNKKHNRYTAKRKTNKRTAKVSGNVGKLGRGVDVANFALKFVGNRYVYGGTSLTHGTDCSGFVKGVYKKFGISLPRTSGAQRGSGQLVCKGWNQSKAKPGDVVCYNGHVAIYIGGGRIVHASNRRDGIKISNKVNYRSVSCVRRIFK